MRGRRLAHRPRLRTHRPRLWHLLLGEAELEPPEDDVEQHEHRADGGGLLADGERRGLGNERPGDAVLGLACRLRLGHPRGGPPRSGLREGGDDRLLRPRPRSRSQGDLQALWPARIRFLHRPHVRLEPVGQQADIPPLSAGAQQVSTF